MDCQPNNDFPFTCNLCGERSPFQAAHFENPELPSCAKCGSNVRFRWLLDRITRDFPASKSTKAIGLTDPPQLAAILTERYNYLNTNLDTLDIRRDPSPLGELDFLIASEVFEHVEPPVMDAFHNAAKMLKPGGVLFFTAPWVHEGDGKDVIPELHDWKLISEANGYTIVEGNTRYPNMAFDGGPGPSLGYTREHFPNWPHREGYQNLVWHGGPGFALEMRLFTRRGIEGNLRAAGFTSIEFDNRDNRDLGIVYPYPWGYPVVARKESP